MTSFFAESGMEIGDVELPAWANGNPYEFVRINRQAETRFSDFVTRFGRICIESGMAKLTKSGHFI